MLFRGICGGTGTDEGDRRATAHRDGGACLEHVHDLDSGTRGRRGDGMEPDRACRDRHSGRGSRFRKTRSMAIVHVSVHDSVNAMTGEYETYLPIKRRPRIGSPEAAAIASAHYALTHLFPAQTMSLNGARMASLSARGLSEADPGIAFGRSRCGRRAVASSNDGAAQAQFPTLRRARERQECGWRLVLPRRFFPAGAACPRGCCGANRNSGLMGRRHSTAGDTHAITTKSGTSDRSRA